MGGGSSLEGYTLAVRNEALRQTLIFVSKHLGEWKDKPAQEQAFANFLKENPLYHHHGTNELHTKETLRKVITNVVCNNRPKRTSYLLQDFFIVGAAVFKDSLLEDIGWYMTKTQSPAGTSAKRSAALLSSSALDDRQPKRAAPNVRADVEASSPDFSTLSDKHPVSHSARSRISEAARLSGASSKSATQDVRREGVAGAVMRPAVQHSAVFPSLSRSSRTGPDRPGDVDNGQQALSPATQYLPQVAEHAAPRASADALPSKPVGAFMLAKQRKDGFTAGSMPATAPIAPKSPKVQNRRVTAGPDPMSPSVATVLPK